MPHLLHDSSEAGANDRPRVLINLDSSCRRSHLPPWDLFRLDPRKPQAGPYLTRQHGCEFSPVPRAQLQVVGTGAYTVQQDAPGSPLFHLQCHKQALPLTARQPLFHKFRPCSNAEQAADISQRRFLAVRANLGFYPDRSVTAPAKQHHPFCA